MKETKKLLIMLTLSAMAMMPLALNAQDDDDIDPLQINKDSIEQGITMLEQSGQLSPEQAKAAREELKNKSQGEIEALKMQAIERVKSGNIPTLPQQVPPPTTSAAVTVPSSTPSAVPTTVESTLAPASVTPAPAPTAAPAPAAAANNDAKLKEALKFLDSGK